MAISRQEFIRLLSAAIAGAPAYFESDLEKRCSRYIREYDSQGIHRTGASPDLRSARWLEAHARRLGAKSRIEHFAAAGGIRPASEPAGWSAGSRWRAFWLQIVLPEPSIFSLPADTNSVTWDSGITSVSSSRRSMAGCRRCC